MHMGTNGNSCKKYERSRGPICEGEEQEQEEEEEEEEVDEEAEEDLRL